MFSKSMLFMLLVAKSLPNDAKTPNSIGIKFPDTLPSSSAPELNEIKAELITLFLDVSDGELSDILTIYFEDDTAILLLSDGYDVEMLQNEINTRLSQVAIFVKGFGPLQGGNVRFSSPDIIPCTCVRKSILKFCARNEVAEDGCIPYIRNGIEGHDREGTMAKLSLFEEVHHTAIWVPMLCTIAGAMIVVGVQHACYYRQKLRNIRKYDIEGEESEYAFARTEQP
eukprot:m.343766 g.343766  ORF g.343766 m.343766 type:complete len:226 (+) comp23267_c0_seq1:271-948(+)